MDLRNISSKYRVPLLGALLLLFVLALSFTTISSFILLLNNNIVTGAVEHLASKGYAYGNWTAVLLSVAIFSFFIVSFLFPSRKFEWRNLGVVEAFLIALFAEMYGFPLTIYILSSYFGIQISYGHVEGHLLASLLSALDVLKLREAWLLVMGASNALIVMGLILLAEGWRNIYNSGGKVVDSGVYRYVRHPQYLGLIMLAFGLLVQWTTFLALLMFPILTLMYYRLAKREERELEELHGENYLRYRLEVPMFLPRLKLLERSK